MTRFCPNCGIQVGDTTKFCGKCGTRVEQQVNEQPQSAQQFSWREQPQQTQPPPQYEPPQPSQEPTRYEPPQPAQEPPRYEPSQPLQESPQYEQPQPMQEPQQSEQPQPAQQQQYEQTYPAQPVYPQYSPPPYAQPQQQYMQDPSYPPPLRTPPKKKHRIPLILIIIAGLVVLSAAIVGALLLLLGNTANQDLIKIGKDEIPSVKYILGEKRNVISIDNSIRNGISKKVIVYNVTANQNADMTTYIRALHDNYGFIHIKDNDFSGPVGVDIELAKKSVEDGYIIIVQIDYDHSGYTIAFTRIKGELTVNEENSSIEDVTPVPDSEQASSENIKPIPTPGPQTSESPPSIVELLPANPVLDSYIAIMSGDTFYMNAHMQSGEGADDEEMPYGIGIDMTCEIAKQGDMIAMSFEEYGMRMIIKDNKSYTVMDSMETVIVTDSTGDVWLDAFIPETTDLVHIGTGSGTLFGRVLSYEAYSEGANTNAETRFYMDGETLVGIQDVEDEIVSMSLEIFELSENIPAGMFDIPSDYNVIEG